MPLDRRTDTLTAIMQALGTYRFGPVQTILVGVQALPGPSRTVRGWPVLSSHLKLFWSSTVHLIYYIYCRLLFISSTIYTVVYYPFLLYILLLFIVSILYTDYFILVYMLFYTYYLPSYLYMSLYSVLLYYVFIYIVVYKTFVFLSVH